MADRQTSGYDLTFAGQAMCAHTKAVITSFADDLPEPKVFKVDIPAGIDLDITDSLGRVGYHNGRHTLQVAVTGKDEDEVLERVRWIVTLLHGKMGDYTLSWHQGYTYRGRFAVAVERVGPRGAMLTITCDRRPWRYGTREYVDVNLKASAASTVAYALSGSKRYHDVRVTNKQPVTVQNPEIGTLSLEDSGTHRVASDFFGYTTLTMGCEDWWLYVDGTDLKVNTAANHFAISGSDLAWNGDPTHVMIDMAPVSDPDAGVDITFMDEELQHVTLAYTRWDL